MAIKFQYNKTSLTNLGKQLKIRQRALPTLKNKESALRVSVIQAKAESDRLQRELDAALKTYDYMAGLWTEFDPGLITVKDVVLDTVKNSPFGRIFMARGLYGGWIPIIALFLCLYCDKRYALMFAPVLLFMATLLICPVVSSRYMLGLLHVCPLLLGLACSALGSRANPPAVKEAFYAHVAATG